MTDLDAMLQRLADLTPAAEQRAVVQLREEYEDEDYELDGGLWLTLEAPQDRDYIWRCGWRYQPDEATQWTIAADGATPTEAAAALLAMMTERESTDAN